MFWAEEKGSKKRDAAKEKTLIRLRYLLVVQLIAQPALSIASLHDKGYRRDLSCPPEAYIAM
jgi:hypothetical protein